MAINQETFNADLYKLLRTRGYKPVPKDVKNQRTQPAAAEVFNFTFTKDGKDYGDAWVTIDDAQNVVLYYSNEQEESPSGKSPNLDYDDSWSGLKRHLKQWSMSKQLSFELRNKDELGDDMAQRDYVKKKDKMNEGYHSMGKKASYNDNIPAVKIILQHNRQIEEGEQRYRNVAKIFLENQDGERFLAPTTRPGIAQVYARHIAEGGVPNDERWNHVKSLCEEYGKMAGFVRATKNKQFNESAQSLVTEGINHYQSLRETLGKLRGHRGYNTYFESWTPALMEDDTDGTQINELFVQETLDPRIESVMPILSRLHKKTGETQVKEVKELEQWADSIVEGDNGEEYDTATLQKMFGPETAHDAASHKPAMMNRKDKAGKSHSLVKLPNGNYRSSDVDEGEETLPEGDMIGRNLLKRGAYKAALTVLADVVARKMPIKKHSIEYYAADIARSYPGVDPRELTAMYKEQNLTNAVEEGRPSQSHPLEGHEYHKKSDAELIYIAKDARAAAEAAKSMNNTTAENKYMDQANDSATVRHFRKTSGMPDWYKKKYGHIKEELEEDLDPQQKKAGQLGPTEKVSKEGAVGKLVGANEAVAHDSSEESVIMDIVNGNIDAYDVMNYPKTEAEQKVSGILQDMYERISIDRRLHPDDDFEEIFEIMMDELSSEYDPYPMSESINENAQDSVANALYTRVTRVRTDLLNKYGIGAINDAIDEISSRFAGEELDEIGSSDVSGWIRQLEQILADTDSLGFNDDDDFDPDFVYGKSEPEDEVDSNDFGDFGDDPRDTDLLEDIKRLIK